MIPSWDDIKHELKNVIVSRVAAIIKERDDGSVKVRIIIDILQIMLNSFAKINERIVLPCLVITDPIDLASACLATR